MAPAAEHPRTGGGSGGTTTVCALSLGELGVGEEGVHPT